MTAGPGEAAAAALPEGHPLNDLLAADRAALGVALAQTLFCALAEGTGASCSDGLQRLLVEVRASVRDVQDCNNRYKESGVGILPD